MRAQRRPERQPRRHSRVAVTGPLSSDDAQRRPERQPRRHAELADSLALVHSRSTKAGASTPATLATPAARWLHPPALNEGRSVNPGDTRMRDWCEDPDTGAQRRPERQPRRHGAVREMCHRGIRRSTKAGASTPATLPGDGDEGARRQRSTKAGASTPATLELNALVSDSATVAQRRPERQPRRHAQRIAHCRPDGSAQRRPERQPRRHTSALPLSLSMICAQRRPERQPRRHRRRNRRINPVDQRSTKAGASTPATPLRRAQVDLARRRSTKAGASTPATLCQPIAALIAENAAQRRPERQPRRHLLASSSCGVSRIAQRRPERQPRRHPR